MVTPINHYRFAVASGKFKERNYTVTYDTDNKEPVIACTCERFKYKKSESDQCKHIIEVKMYLQNKPTDIYQILGQLKVAIDFMDEDHIREYFLDIERILLKPEIVKKLYF